jgi:ribosomal-protein-alanine N-acetyltransferase
MMHLTRLSKQVVRHRRTPQAGGVTDRGTGDVIETERLRLVPVPLDALDALAADDPATASRLMGFPVGELRPGHSRVYALRASQIRTDARVAPWLLRLVVDRTTGHVVGDIGLHDAPHDGMVEIGYSIRAEHRRRGIAIEAAAGLLSWAATQPGVTTFRASISPDNAASLGLVRRLGFVEVGEQWDDEDGLEVVLERPAARLSVTGSA